MAREEMRAHCKTSLEEITIGRDDPEGQWHCVSGCSRFPARTEGNLKRIIVPAWEPRGEVEGCYDKSEVE